MCPGVGCWRGVRSRGNPAGSSQCVAGCRGVVTSTPLRVPTEPTRDTGLTERVLCLIFAVLCSNYDLGEDMC